MKGAERLLTVAVARCITRLYRSKRIVLRRDEGKAHALWKRLARRLSLQKERYP